MKSKAWKAVFFLVLVVVGQPLHAQQSEIDAKKVAEIRARAENGDGQAQYVLAWCYENGEGLAKDDAESLRWLLKSAAQNYVSAQFCMGVFHALGKGVAKDEVEAVRWYRKAAEQNHANAQFNLGVCYASGQGVAKNETEAVKWYRRAADQNFAEAQFRLATFYANGDIVPKDESEAMNWYRKAAEQDLVSAQYELGILCMRSIGVRAGEELSLVDRILFFKSKSKDEIKVLVEAYMWLLLAGSKGYKDSKEIMKSLEDYLPREHLAAGQKLAREFQPKAFSSSAGTTMPSGKEAEIRRMLKLTGAISVAEQVKSQIFAGFRSQLKDVPYGFWERFEKKVNVEELMEKIIPLYDKYYSLEDLRAINAFYVSEVGQRLIKTMPNISRESLAVGMEWGKRIGEQVEREARAELESKSGRR